MPDYFKFFISAVLPVALLLSPANVQAEQQILSVENIQVEDGDTIIVLIGSDSYRIQLAGIDAPEDTENPKLNVDIKRTKLEKQDLLDMGMLATRHLRFLVSQNRPFKLHFDPAKKDRYGRIPGDIVTAGRLSLSELMLSDGFAIVTTHSTSNELIKQLQPLQSKARSEKKGLWGNNSVASDAWAGIKTGH